MIATRALKRTDDKGRPKRVYDVRLRDPAGRVINRTFETKRAAKQWGREHRSDLGRGIWLDPRHGSLTVADLGAEWLAANPAKRSGTRARDESILRRHIAPTLGARPIASVTKPMTQALVNSWSQIVQPRTVKRQYGVLTAMFSYAVDADYLARTPCGGGFDHFRRGQNWDSRIVNLDQIQVAADHSAGVGGQG
jgi:hypothetical protein